MAAALLHQETFRVRFFEAEPNGRAAPGALCRFAQETADCHCRTFGMSLAQLRAQNKMWVLTRFRLQMLSYPLNGDWLTVETWASSRTNGIRAVREFRFLDAHGKQLGRAASIWLMLDETRKRPVRLPQSVMDIRNAERSDPHEFEIPRLKAPENPTHSTSFDVGWKDLDANDHANNVNYVEWALEALPLETRRTGTLSQLDIEFLAQAFYGDQVISSAGGAGEVWSHSLKNGGGVLLCVATSQWALAEAPRN